jgi:hypothetical protein
MTTIYELHAINMDGRFEVRTYDTIEEARKWRKAYGNGKIYKVMKEEVE